MAIVSVHIYAIWGHSTSKGHMHLNRDFYLDVKTICAFRLLKPSQWSQFFIVVATPPALTIEVSEKKKHLSLPPLNSMVVAPMNGDIEKPPEKPEKKHKKKKKHKEKTPRKDKERPPTITEKPATPDIIRGASNIVLDDLGKKYSSDDLFNTTPRSLPTISNTAPSSTSFMIDNALSRALGDNPDFTPPR